MQDTIRQLGVKVEQVTKIQRAYAMGIVTKERAIELLMHLGIPRDKTDELLS